MMNTKLLNLTLNDIRQVANFIFIVQMAWYSPLSQQRVYYTPFLVETDIMTSCIN